MKCFFVNAQIPEVGFLLRRAAPTTLVVAQTLATEIEHDLILAGQIRIEPSGSSSLDSFSSSTRTNPMVQKLANELLALKRQLAQGVFSSPYEEDVPRRPYLPAAHNFALEAPPTDASVEDSDLEESDLACLFQEKEADIAGDSQIWFMQFQKAVEQEEKTISDIYTRRG